MCGLSEAIFELGNTALVSQSKYLVLGNLSGQQIPNLYDPCIWYYCIVGTI